MPSPGGTAREGTSNSGASPSSVVVEVDQSPEVHLLHPHPHLHPEEFPHPEDHPQEESSDTEEELYTEEEES